MKLSRTMREGLTKLVAAGETEADELGLRGVTRPTLEALGRRGLAESRWERRPGRVWGFTLWKATEAGRAALAP